ncbi:MAG TPA: tetratricopeptide repeat protein [Terriglobia bacterium]|nr:tetratricopeptide repeat protein [Terriglobia bacterium]
MGIDRSRGVFTALRASRITSLVRNPVVVLALFLTAALAPQPALAQQASNVSLDASEQIFSVLTALNAAGYDTGIGADTGEHTREQVRAVLAKQRIPVLPDLRKFYAAHQITNDSAADLGQFISLALLLGPPPDFKPTVAMQDLPPDAKHVAGLIPLLKKFYQQADLVELWSHVQPRYEAEIARYSDPVRQSVTLSDVYLRSPSGAYLGRNYHIYLSLLAAPNQVQARIYGSDYFLVVTPSKELKVPEIRHQYLHFMLDALPLKYAAEVQKKSELLAVAHNAPVLAPDFKADFSLLLTECLIRAVELRMDKRPKAEAEKTAQDVAAQGLILTPYFYDALADYEEQESAMSVYYKPLVLGIDPDEVSEQMAKIKFAPAPKPVATASGPPESAEDRLVDQGDNLVYQGSYKEAHDVFESVLAKDPASPRALYGMAVVASNTRKPDLAEEYFKKTLEVARDLRLVTWSHVYLGRLYDLKGERDKALEQYRAASVTAGAYPDALRAVQDGLRLPFGTK